VPALERLTGIRLVADPSAIDGAVWQAESPRIVLRLAPDEAYFVSATEVTIQDDHAITAREDGFVGCSMSLAVFEADVLPHLEWPLPSERPALAQGAVAGVPAKLWFPDPTDASEDDDVILVTWATYAHDLADRLGWSVALEPEAWR